MPIYVYVQAKVSEPVEDPGSISFQHHIVLADDDDDAYLQGQRWGDKTPFIKQRAPNETINDYVIKTDGDQFERIASGR